MKSGCTAMILDIDLNNLISHFSNAGDSRLVICSTLNHQITLQTNDLNTKTASERERLSLEHPNEGSMFIQNRLFGRLMCTRGEYIMSLTTLPSITIHFQGFGDGYYKLPKGPLGDVQYRKYIKTLSSIERPGIIPLIDQYESLFYGYKTPPYITARPETGQYQFKSCDIAILATDGLWDLISGEAAAQIILHGATHNEDHLAKYLLEQVIDLGLKPQDDVTIIIFLA